MRTALHQPPVRDHEQPRRLAQRRQPVGDGEHGASGDEPLQRLLNRSLGLRVHARGRLVQDEDARVVQDRPRDRHALALAARKGVSPLTHHGVIAVLQLADEVVGVGGPRRRDRLLERRPGQSVPDVLEHGPVKQVRVLQHHPDLAAVVSGLESPQVHAVDPDRAARDVVEARDQVDDRRLASARRSDQTDQLARRHLEAHTTEHLADAVVGEGDVFERDPAADRLEPHRARRVADLGLGIEHLEHAVRRRRGALHGARHLADDLDRPDEHRRVQEERDERSPRQCRPDAQQARHGQHPHAERGGVHGEHEQRPERGPQAVQPVDLVRHVVVVAVEPRDLARLLVERLDDADPGHGVRQHVREARPLAPHAQEHAVEGFAVSVDRPAEQRHGKRHHQAEPPVERHQHGAESRQHHERERHVHHAERQELPQPVGVGRHACDEAPRALAREECEAEPLQVLVQLGAQVARDPLAQHGHQPQPQQRRRLADQVHERHRGDGEPGNRRGATGVEPTLLRRPDHAVDHVPREVRWHQAHERDQRGRGHAEREPAAIWREVAEQAPDNRHLTPGHEGLRVTYRTRDARHVFLVRVRRGDRAPLERFLEHELQVLVGAPLAVAVAQHRERRIAGTAQDRERAGRQTGRLAHRLDAGALDAVDLPPRSTVHRPGHAQMAGSECDPHVSEPQGVVQVGERVQLHRSPVPRRLDQAPQLGRQPGRLVGVALHNLGVEGVEVLEVMEVVTLSIHARDPCSNVQTTRTASRGSVEHPGRPDHGSGSYPSRGLVGAAPRRRTTQYAHRAPSAARPGTRIPGWPSGA